MKTKILPPESFGRSQSKAGDPYIVITLDTDEARELAKQIKNVYPRYVNRLLDNLRIQLEELTKEEPMPSERTAR
jgi:hypothetical protein